MQQAVLDDWFLRQDILDQLMNQEEEASEAERYADRIMRIAQEDSAEHQVLTDPFAVSYTHLTLPTNREV